jgi:hypothetical protein
VAQSREQFLNVLNEILLKARGPNASNTRQHRCRSRKDQEKSHVAMSLVEGRPRMSHSSGLIKRAMFRKFGSERSLSPLLQFQRTTIGYVALLLCFQPACHAWMERSETRGSPNGRPVPDCVMRVKTR